MTLARQAWLADRLDLLAEVEAILRDIDRIEQERGSSHPEIEDARRRAQVVWENVLRQLGSTSEIRH